MEETVSNILLSLSMPRRQKQKSVIVRSSSNGHVATKSTQRSSTRKFSLDMKHLRKSSKLTDDFCLTMSSPGRDEMKREHRTRMTLRGTWHYPFVYRFGSMFFPLNSSFSIPDGKTVGSLAQQCCRIDKRRDRTIPSSETPNPRT